MALWSLEELKSALQDDIIATIYNSNDQSKDGLAKDGLVIDKIVIDSRAATQNSLFIALLGPNNDGHNFVSQAAKNGAAIAIVDKIKLSYPSNLLLFFVKNSANALTSLAKYARKRSQAQIIAVTGSVGKSSIKEMLKITLASGKQIYASPGNLNNQFGLPLSLCNLPKECSYGIFELGMNHPGEITELSNLAKPDLAIISNITAAHIGNFNNEEEIALAKSEIFSGLKKGGKILLNHDNPHYDLLYKQALNYKIAKENIFNFGSKKDSNISLLKNKIISPSLSEVTVNLFFPKEPSLEIRYFLSSINKTTIFNSLIIVGVLKLLKLNLESYLYPLSKWEAVKGRGNLINVTNKLNYSIIDDSYNANLSSMIGGLEFLVDLKQALHKKRTIAVIGDMLELGQEAIKQHEQLIDHLERLKIDKVFLVGNLMHNLLSRLPQDKLLGVSDTSLKAAQIIPNLLQDGDLLLVKGSHSMKLEIIIDELTNNHA